MSLKAQLSISPEEGGSQNMFDVDLKVSLYCLVKEHTYCVGMAIWSKALPAPAAANFASHCCTMADDVTAQLQEQHSACI